MDIIVSKKEIKFVHQFIDLLLLIDIFQMFSFQNSSHYRPSVHELLTYYKRQKILLRDDGTRLIRPIPRPNFMINNDDVHVGEILGKVCRRRKIRKKNKKNKCLSSRVISVK